MRIAILTNEYPPSVYGGAGVHVEYLTQELAHLDEGAHSVSVLCFGDQKEVRGALRVEGVRAPIALHTQDPRHDKLFSTMVQDLVMSGRLRDIDILHCHTWYTHLAGCLGKCLHRVPLVLTTHSLEPHRPWKAEQLGTAYDVSTWIERTAYQNADGVVAVSAAMKHDVHDLYGVSFDRIRVIHNGIDPQQYRPTPDVAMLLSRDIAPDVPYVLFVGRVTRQKGILHLVNAIEHLDPGVQVVLCAGAPDTPEIALELTTAVERARARSPHRIVWITEMLPKEAIITLYTHAAVFVCPSVSSPSASSISRRWRVKRLSSRRQLEASPKSSSHGETGLLVAPEVMDSTEVEPRHPQQFSRDLASATNALLRNPEMRAAMGKKARARVEQQFSWSSVARQTLTFYQEVLTRHAKGGEP